jgi:FimV-like protein
VTNKNTAWILVLLVGVVSLASATAPEYTVLLDPPVLRGQYRGVVTKAPGVTQLASAGNASVASASAEESFRVSMSAKSQAKTESPQAPKDESFDSPSSASEKSSASASHTVEPGDTLYEIARQYRPNDDIGRSQMVMAIFRANPDAFSQGNINNLKTGVILRIPNGREIAAVGEEVVIQSSENLPPQENPSPQDNLPQRGAGTQSQEDVPERIVMAQSDEDRPPQEPGTQTQEELRERKEEAEQRALNLFLRDLAVLFPAGQLQLEASTFYASDRRTSLSVGDFFIPSLTIRSAQTTFIARYGLTDRLQMTLAIPFSYIEREIDTTLLEGGERNVVDELGLGDIGAGLSYQLLNERGARPAVALDLDATSDTGDELPGVPAGQWNVGSQINMVKTIDPVTFFGGVGYTTSLEQDGNDLGNQYLYQFGTGFSLNDRVSLDVQVFGAAVERRERNGKEISGSSADIISLQFGATTLVSNNVFIEPVVGVGLTEDATDAVVGINVVYQVQRQFPLPFLASR